VKISRAAMKAAQEAAKAAKHHLQRKEKIIFQIFKKASVLQLALFMRIIFCNGKKETNLSHFGIRHQYLNTKHDSSCCPLYLFYLPVR
jgi:hypothetical protein